MTTNTIDYEADHLARKVSDAAMKASSQAKELYGEVTGKARKVVQQVDPYVKGKPYATMGMVAVAGLLLGLIMAGRGPKVIYVEPKD